jgi:cytidylate kinase
MKEHITGKMDAVFAHQLQQLQRELQSMRITPKPFITISREFGCEGFPLAKKLSELLSTDTKPWHVYGHDVIREISIDDEFTNSLWENIPNETRNVFTQYLDATLANKPTDYMLFRKMAKSIKILATSGHVILVGAAATVLTKDSKYAYHFRLVGSEEFKINRIIEMGYSGDEAKIMVKERDDKRFRFVQQFTGADIRNPNLYTAVFNNSILNVNDISTMILSLIKHHTPEFA